MGRTHFMNVPSYDVSFELGTGVSQVTNDLFHRLDNFTFEPSSRTFRRHERVAVSGWVESTQLKSTLRTLPGHGGYSPVFTSTRLKNGFWHTTCQKVEGLDEEISKKHGGRLIGSLTKVRLGYWRAERTIL